MAVLARSTARYQRPEDAHPVLLEDPAVLAVAAAHGAAPAAVALSWALRRRVAVIPKSTHADRIRANMEVDHASIHASTHASTHTSIHSPSSVHTSPLRAAARRGRSRSRPR
jgi:diketogulonate reductase-like aldo/keto reductase